MPALAKSWIKPAAIGLGRSLFVLLAILNALQGLLNLFLVIVFGSNLSSLAGYALLGLMTLHGVTSLWAFLRLTQKRDKRSVAWVLGSIALLLIAQAIAAFSDIRGLIH